MKKTISRGKTWFEDNFQKLDSREFDPFRNHEFSILQQVQIKAINWPRYLITCFNSSSAVTLLTTPTFKMNRHRRKFVWSKFVSIMLLKPVILIRSFSSQKHRGVSSVVDSKKRLIISD